MTAASIRLVSTHPEVHEAFRGKRGVPSRGAIAGTRGCRKAGIHVRAKTTMTSENCDGVEPVLSLAADSGAIAPQVLCHLPTGPGSSWDGPSDCGALAARLVERIDDPPRPVRPTCAPQFMRIVDRLGVVRPGCGAAGDGRGCRVYRGPARRRAGADRDRMRGRA